MADDQVSEDEKIKICKEFIRFTPPGELKQVYRDVASLLDQNIDNNEELQTCALDYYQDQTFPVVIPTANGDQQQSLVSLHGYQSNGKFYCPRQHVCFNFDPLTESVSNIENAPDHLRNTDAEPYRQALQTQVNDYIKQYYPAGVCAVFARKDGENTELIIQIEDHEFQHKNRWNGNWRSEWLLTISDKVHLQGAIKLHVHYYENSNVQMVTKHTLEDKELVANSTDAEEIANEAAKIIKEFENKYHTSLRDSYVTMSDTTFKTLRRVLPMSKQKINWDNIGAYGVGNEITKSTSK